MLENPSSRVRREVLVQRVLLEVELGAVRVHRREQQREVRDARGRDDDADVHREHAPSERGERGGGKEFPPVRETQAKVVVEVGGSLKGFFFVLFSFFLLC